MEVPVLEIRDLGVAFADKRILEAIDIVLPAQGIDVLLGASRSGKSTLLNTLAGNYRGHSAHTLQGEVRYCGEPLSDEHRPVLVNQTHNLRNVHQSLLECLLDPLRQSNRLHLTPIEWREKGVQLLLEAGLEALLPWAEQDLLELPPHFRLAVQIYSRIALAPALLMIDVPCCHLDPEAVDWLIARLQNWRNRARLWVVLDELEQARLLADRVMVLAQGRLICHQTAGEFFADAAQTCQTLPEVPHDSPPGEEAPALAILPELADELVVEAEMVGEVLLRDRSAPQGFHWIIPGRLATCSEPGQFNALDGDLAELRRIGISRLITLSRRNLCQNALARNGLANLHLSLNDQGVPSMAQMHMLLVRIERLLQEGQVLAIYCQGGLGPTGTVLGAWLIRAGKFAVDEAIRRLRQIEPGFIQSSRQEAFLAEYENDLLLRLA